jgi:hypothetical protein
MPKFGITPSPIARVREDLQKALLEQVRGLVPQLRKPEYESHFSELSDEGDGYTSMEARNGTRQLAGDGANEALISVPGRNCRSMFLFLPFNG